MFSSANADVRARQLRERVETVLTHLGVAFGTNGENLVIADAAGAAGIETMSPFPVRVRVRESVIELATTLVERPSDDAVANGFWYEWQRPADATFFAVLPAGGGLPERLALMIRIPVAPERMARTKPLLVATIKQALFQLARSRNKAFNGDYAFEVGASKLGDKEQDPVQEGAAENEDSGPEGADGEGENEPSSGAAA